MHDNEYDLISPPDNNDVMITMMMMITMTVMTMMITMTAMTMIVMTLMMMTKDK